MKKIFFLVLVFLILPTISFGTPITVSSYKYDIFLSGGFYGTEEWQDIVFSENHSYSGSGSGSNISHSRELSSSWAGRQYVSAGVRPFGISIDFVIFEKFGADVGVRAEWTFTPRYDNLSIDMTRFVSLGTTADIVYGDMSFKLINIAGDIVLASLSHSELTVGSKDVSYRDYCEFKVSKTNSYKAILEEKAWGADSARVASQIQFGVVPEPSTLLLLGSCIVGLIGFRRKFRK